MLIWNAALPLLQKNLREKLKRAAAMSLEVDAKWRRTLGDRLQNEDAAFSNCYDTHLEPATELEA